MAKINNGYFGSYQGKIGAVTGFKRLGLFYIRQSINQNLSKSPLQLDQRSKFKQCVQSLRGFAVAANIGFSKTKGNGRTAYNNFVSRNYFSNPTGGGVIDPSKIIVSEGNGINIMNPSIACSGAHTLKANWGDNTMESLGTTSADHVYFTIYDKVDGVVIMGVAKRSEATLTIPLPANWTGRSVFTYVFTQNEVTGEISNTLYCGTISVE